MGSMATKCQPSLELLDQPGYMSSIILGLRSKLLRDLCLLLPSITMNLNDFLIISEEKFM